MWATDAAGRAVAGHRWHPGSAAAPRRRRAPPASRPLPGLLLPAVQKAGERGRQSDCINNLRQFAMGWTMYKDDRKATPQDQYAPFLSALYPEYVSSTNQYLCKSDMQDGREGGKAEWMSEAP